MFAIPSFEPSGTSTIIDGTGLAARIEQRPDYLQMDLRDSEQRFYVDPRVAVQPPTVLAGCSDDRLADDVWTSVHLITDIETPEDK